MANARAVFKVVGTGLFGLMGGFVLGFVGPFAIAQFDEANAPAWSFVPLIAMPVGALLGAVVGVGVGFLWARAGRKTAAALAATGGGAPSPS